MDQLSVEQAFQVALQHYKAGHFPQAEQVYRQILARQPNHAEALHNLGVIAAQTGRHEIAVELIGRAIHLKPNYVEAYSNLGNVLQIKGQFDEAIAAYRQAIALRPTDAEACNNLGAALENKGQLDEAIAAYRQAIAHRSTLAEAHCNFGVALQKKGQPDEAIAACQRAISLKPTYAEAHYNLGAALSDKGQLDEAIAACRQAIALRPTYAEAHTNLGVALQKKGQLDEAIAAYQGAIAVRPAHAEAHANLGAALQDKGQLDEAIAAYRRAIALEPAYAEAHYNLGTALTDQGQLDEAIAACRQAIALKPTYAEAYGNLGVALQYKGQLDEAIAACRQAIALRPTYAEAHNNLGAALQYSGQPDEAIAAYQRAIAVAPTFAEAHKNLALVLLTQGKFAQGWREYEWRLKQTKASSRRRNFPQPLWDGRPLEGNTLLLHTEQGFGDSLQFIRYLPLVEQRGGRIIVECRAEQRRLLESAAGNCILVARGQPLPAFDVHCPLLSLPLLFGTTLENIPRQVPYLYADVEAAMKWRERLMGNANSINVGVAWAGSESRKNDNRSKLLSALAPLSRVQGVIFYSLQKGEQAPQARNPPAGMELIDWTADIHDFADTAALVANLDLVISVDTAVVHLAGAMGKPTWVLLPFVADWRWLLDREDSPWYPTMRLFRQPSIGDWASPIRQMADALGGLVHRTPFASDSQARNSTL